MSSPSKNPMAEAANALIVITDAIKTASPLAHQTRIHSQKSCRTISCPSVVCVVGKLILYICCSATNSFHSICLCNKQISLDECSPQSAHYQRFRSRPSQSIKGLPLAEGQAFLQNQMCDCAYRHSSAKAGPDYWQPAGSLPLRSPGTGGGMFGLALRSSSL